MNFIITQQQMIDITNLIGEIPTKIGFPVISILQSLKPLEQADKIDEGQGQ